MHEQHDTTLTRLLIFFHSQVKISLALLMADFQNASDELQECYSLVKAVFLHGFLLYHYGMKFLSSLI